MVTECVAALLVVDDDGYAVGIVTQTDLLRAYQLLPSMQLVRLRSADLMSTDFVTCSPETPISEAVALLTRNHLHRVVVVKPNTQRLYPLGMLAMSDIVREVTGEFDVA